MFFLLFNKIDLAEVNYIVASLSLVEFYLVQGNEILLYCEFPVSGSDF